MSRPTLDELAKAAGAVILTAPAKRSKYANSCVVDRTLLDELAAMVARCGYDLPAARKRMKEIGAKRAEGRT